jgi:hypothetical protein
VDLLTKLFNIIITAIGMLVIVSLLLILIAIIGIPLLIIYLIYCVIEWMVKSIFETIDFFKK